jgi:uncharacterized protein (TIGR00369 family)
MVFADHVLGELAFMRRPPHCWALTSELTLDIVRDVEPDDVLCGRATAVGGGAHTGFAQCHITDHLGQLVAVGTTRTVYVRQTDSAPPPLANPAAVSDISAETIEDLLGLEHTATADGAHVTMKEPGGWVNGYGILHGGVAACIAEVAARRVVTDRNPQLSIAQLHTSYVRPGRTGASFTASARAYHVGKGFAVVEVVGLDGSGELCTVSTVTARRAETAKQHKEEGPRDD